MSYRTILVHVDDSTHAPSRIALAARIARVSEGSHLVGAAMTGVSRFVYGDALPQSRRDAMLPFVDQQVELLARQAQDSLDRFEEIVRGGDVSYEPRLVNDDVIGGLALHAPYCDVIVLGQYDSDDPASMPYGDLPESVAMASGCPVLVVPHARAANAGAQGFLDNVLVAWDASIEATRAVHQALPLLKAARQIQVAVFNAQGNEDARGVDPGVDIALFLARHGIRVEVVQRRAGGDIGEALIGLAAERGSSMMVMGCYGHSRFREILLGGATRTVLRDMRIPVLMAH
ncbi:Nucleotide-binding universal stress protein, UspA family [Noviherbaspirillum humi]|uniref:Nucleotide-binding universal stress protein, UspA family n=1 Tax=Noviherbaspirillum humi TaxID=1688639 RepID=A0A239HNE2_9BURK|nr:universal stress protein [Noviherbaspirillum humi]SNS82879.1 Nucleotide-binding universal stress protein, UspA family [Noviherbaspirillum humi]